MAEKTKWISYGIVGPPLSSFLRFANHYYGYYVNDDGDRDLINRHAILHGSIDSFANKVNVVKLISFLYLFLELEDVFKILLEED